MSENFVNRRKARRFSSDNMTNNEVESKIEIITEELQLASNQFVEAIKVFQENKEAILEEDIKDLEKMIQEIEDDIKLVSEDFEYLKNINHEITKKKAKLNIDNPKHQEKLMENIEELLDNLNDLEDEVQDLNDEIIDLFDDIEELTGEYIYKDGKKVHKFESIEDISDIINKAFSKVKETFSFDFNVDKSSKNHTLVALLPFLDDEELSEIADMIINDHEDLKGLKLATIFPFLSTEKCDEIFLAKMTSIDSKELSSLVPFVSQQTLTKLVDEYLEGNFEKINMNALYPFLDKADIKRIFFHELKKNKQ